MKKLILANVVIATTALLFSFNAHASTILARSTETPKTRIASEASFTIEVNEFPAGERIHVTIKNPTRKNLYVSLNGPDGSSLDNFFTGKRCDQTSKLYNFSNADAGTYTLHVSYGNETIDKQIKLEHAVIRSVSKITVQ